jgi:hypothetical protein
MFSKIICASILVSLSLSATASIVEWSPVQDTSSTSDVETIGTLIEAVNPSFSGYDGQEVTVNGVTFTYDSTILDLDTETSLLGEGITSGDADYDTLLSTFDFGATGGGYNYTIADGLLTEGNAYLVQLWFTDSREHLYYDYMSYGDGEGNSVELDNRGENSLGQYAIGYFISDGDGQTLLMNLGESYSNVHLTAYQVREVAMSDYELATASAVDARVGMLGMMGFAMVGFGALRKRRQK